MEFQSWVARLRAGFLATACAMLVACGGGGGGGDSSEAPPPTTMPLTLVSSADRSYGQLRGTSGATLEVHRRGDGTVDQASYINSTSGERVRVLYDADGLPERIVDANNGMTVVVDRVSPERTDFLTYSAAGAYLDGYAMLNRGGQLSVAPILGTPSFSGQLSGQINGALQTGSFSVLPADDTGLGTPVPLTTAQLAVVDALIGSSGVVAPLSGRMAFSQRARLQAVLGIDQRAVIGGIVAGAIVGVGSANPAAGVIAGAAFAYGLQRVILPIIDGVEGADSLEDLSDRLNPFLNGFNDGGSAASSVQASLAGGVASTISDVLSRAVDAARDTIGALLDRATLPSFSATAAMITTPVTGFGVDQQGTGYVYSGDVSPTGGVTLVGVAGDGGAGISASGTLSNGSLTGTSMGRLGGGTLSGEAGALGVCAQLQQSGGQGTFSYAFDAAATSGVVQFFRQAFSIPDGFRVISNGATLYDTGGLVSGSELVALQLNGSRVLFVTVNAPNNGTAWELSLGCPV